MNPVILCVADEETFWPNLRWPDVSSWPDRGGTLVVVPVAGLADWGPGLPMDVEELLLTSVLAEASRRRGRTSLLTVPPLRFVTGPASACAFPVSPPVACALITETVLSIRRAGFERVVLLNSSPWNEELCDAAARDLRIDHAVQMFCINLAALDLDLSPGRSRNRAALGALCSALAGTRPGPLPAEAAGPAADPLGLLGSAAEHLASLLRELHARPPLPDGGRIGLATFA